MSRSTSKFGTTSRAPFIYIYPCHGITPCHFVLRSKSCSSSYWSSHTQVSLSLSLPSTFSPLACCVVGPWPRSPRPLLFYLACGAVPSRVASFAAGSNSGEEPDRAPFPPWRACLGYLLVRRGQPPAVILRGQRPRARRLAAHGVPLW
jgi:hypothetical protein